ncbi:AAA family ATPase [Neobacillus sp. 179-C4.2 HS]|uniref:AAA family ATPase n=1 Tax=Neobacillus driksii TaxID=3035913 RepID=A0ABV4YVA7_9BACI|nr:AAA family ATPase [Neobacillus sp. 179.-C4.2 HS]MDP5192773.1 AAA family ATPase [Neobacillus sp. 179.-C4.2 HS]
MGNIFTYFTKTYFEYYLFIKEKEFYWPRDLTSTSPSFAKNKLHRAKEEIGDRVFIATGVRIMDDIKRFKNLDLIKKVTFKQMITHLGYVKEVINKPYICFYFKPENQKREKGESFPIDLIDTIKNYSEFASIPLTLRDKETLGKLSVIISTIKKWEAANRIKFTTAYIPKGVKDTENFPFYIKNTKSKGHFIIDAFGNSKFLSSATPPALKKEGSLFYSKETLDELLNELSSADPSCNWENYLKLLISRGNEYVKVSLTDEVFQKVDIKGWNQGISTRLLYKNDSIGDVQAIIKTLSNRKIIKLKDDQILLGDSYMKINPNTILYGPPGTGKTYYTSIYAVAIIEQETKTLEEIEKEDYSKVRERYNKYIDQGNIEFTTFHQSYSYEEFIEGIRPVLEDIDQVSGSDKTDNNLLYKLEPGVFKRISDRAKLKFKENESKENESDDEKIKLKENESNEGESDDEKVKNIPSNFVLIIDEINRGNISKIFGELITLIEPSKRMGMVEEIILKLPYSKKSFSVPQNLFILGTMNTADRSIALLDTALRRRFNFIEMLPKPNLLTKDSNDKDLIINGINIQLLLEMLNKRISITIGRDLTIGHSYFYELKEKPDILLLKEIFMDKIIPLLQEYFYDDFSKLRLVLNDTNKEAKYQFFIESPLNDLNSLFGNSIDYDDFQIDSNKKIYELNDSAFIEPNSYIGIYEWKK